MVILSDTPLNNIAKYWFYKFLILSKLHSKKFFATGVLSEGLRYTCKFETWKYFCIEDYTYVVNNYGRKIINNKCVYTVQNIRSSRPSDRDSVFSPWPSL